jgi:hypothetical protein
MSITGGTPDDIFMICIASSKIIITGVHMWNILWSYMQKKRMFSWYPPSSSSEYAYNIKILNIPLVL